MPFELLIVIGVLLVIILILFMFIMKIHNNMFNKRFELDPLVTLYDDEKLNKKNIVFKCGKTSLRGFIYSYPNMNYKGTLVFSHGMFSSHKSYMQEIIYFANQGYKVLGFDYEATSLSDGDWLRGFGNSLRCLDYAIRFVKSNDELNNNKLVVVGHSWGGYAASNILKYHNDIDKVIALAPFASIMNLLKGYLPKFLYFLLPLMLLADATKCGKYSFANNFRTLKNKNNVMVLHSKDDHMVKYEYNTSKLLKKNPKINSLIFNNKRHNPNYTSESVIRLTEYSSKASKLKGDELVEFKKSTDFLSLGKLDKEIMQKIMEFIEK